MTHQFMSDPIAGDILWMTDGHTEIRIALDFGLRILHLSCLGMENLFYVQPADGSDSFVTEHGWKLRGGHRFWLSPESDLSYYPDNAPIAYTLLPNGVELIQDPDPWLQVQKSLRVIFQENGAVELIHEVKNLSHHPLNAALWGINTLAPGGKAKIPFSGSKPGDYTPRRTLALWADTDLGDPRIAFTKNSLAVQHAPSDDYFKIGMFCKDGFAVFENKLQRFELYFSADTPEHYSDLGSNFELYMNSAFMELETLGIRHTLNPGDSACHQEIWRIERL